MFIILATNNIWKSRLVDVGVVSYDSANLFGTSGVVARSSGFRKDLRLLKSLTYSYYWFLKFKSFVGRTGDSFDRFIIRIREMLESVYIIYQLVPLLINFFSSSTNLSEYSFITSKSLNYFNKSNSMESLIEHFKYYSEGIVLPSNHAYASVEAPKGEFGVSLVSNSSPKPFRCKIRTPAYHHLQIMSLLNQGHQFADMITILGSQDIVFGEVDR